MKLSRPIILAGLVLALALFAGCQSEVHNRKSSGSHLDIRDLTETTAYSFTLPEGSDDFRLQLQIRSQAGRFAWRVTDPTGQAAWEGNLDAGSSIQERWELPPVAGEWKLEIQMVEASGGYVFEWESQD